MQKYFVKYGLGGGFGGARNAEVIEVETENEASEYAWEMACQEYDSFAGMHGLRSVEDIMEEDEIEDYDDAEYVYNEERESWLDYAAEIYNSDKHDDYL